MTNDQYMKEVFPQPPIIAYRRQLWVARDFIIIAMVSEPKSPQRHTRVMSKCGQACTACPYIQERNNIWIKENSYWEINRSTNCQGSNVIYMIECRKDRCNEKYVGETGRIFKCRLDEQRMYINTKDETQPTGAHFNLPCTVGLEKAIGSKGKQPCKHTASETQTHSQSFQKKKVAGMG